MVSITPTNFIELKLYDDKIYGETLYKQDKSFLDGLDIKYTIRYNNTIYYLQKKHIDLCHYFSEKIYNQDIYEIKLDYDESLEAFDNFMKIIYGLTAFIPYEQIPDIFLITYEMSFNQSIANIDFTSYFNQLIDSTTQYSNPNYLAKLYDIALIQKNEKLADVFLNKIRVNGWRSILKSNNILKISQNTFEKLMEYHIETIKMEFQINNPTNTWLNAKEIFDLIADYISANFKVDLELTAKYHQRYILYTPNDESLFWVKMWQISEESILNINENLEKNDQNIELLLKDFKDSDDTIKEIQENLKTMTIEIEKM